MIVAEYYCPHHERFEVLESVEAQDERDCPECGTPSPYCISAPSIKPNYASVTQGKGSTERPPGFVSTEAIADGMKTSDYREALAKQRKDRVRAHVRGKLG